MTKEQQEQIARQRFIEELERVGKRATIHNAVEIVERLDLNPHKDRALHESNTRLARKWIAKDRDENGERRWRNIRRENEKGETVQEYVQERFFDVEDYRIASEDDTSALKRVYKKLTRGVDRCFERYGVKLKIDLSFLKPVHVSRRAVKKAQKAAQKERQPRLTDEI